MLSNVNPAHLNMVSNQIKTWQVNDGAVLKSMTELAREPFVPERYQNLAYADAPILLNDEHEMLPPKNIGRALQALKIKKTDKILEIGTQSGYTTALLAALGGSVYSLEANSKLYEWAAKNLAGAQYKQVNLKLADGLQGWIEQAPFDVIMLHASFPTLPQNLLTQLSMQGRCFIILGHAPAMQAMLWQRQPTTWARSTLFETVTLPFPSAAPTPFQF
jgi:protein-L-isoaspartate(D-aspartate) O-methyltransferase